MTCITLCMQSQLSARSAEGRKLRRKVLRGSVLVCIVAGYHGKRFIYERAHELGVRQASMSRLCSHRVSCCMLVTQTL